MRQAGFSLLEIVVAFAVLSLTLGVLFEVFSTGMRTATVSSDYNEAARIADSLLNEYAVTGADRLGDFEGRVEDGPYRWEVRVALLDVEAIGLSEPVGVEPVSISARVSWPAREGERHVTLDTIRLVPDAR
jgi:general secretion pathway protein I